MSDERTPGLGTRALRRIERAPHRNADLAIFALER
jgi:hypothetical protein